MKKMWTKILSAMALSIIGAIIFMFSLCATCKAEQIKYNQLFTNLNSINFGYGWDSDSYEETINEISFIDSGNQHYLNLNYNIDISQYDFITLDFTQKNKLNSNYQFISKLNGYTQQFAFVNDTTIEYVISVSNMNSNGDIYFYNINESFEYNKLVVYLSNTNISSTLPLITMNAISNDEIYANGFEEGYNDAYQYYTNLQFEYNQLLSNYNSLEELYNGVVNGQYTFESLFWSIGSVPMAVLLQTFNVNVLGMNIRAILTGLLTALVVIWLIKRLFK